LHTAAYWGGKEVAALLIAKGADVNAKDKSGATPLGGAIRRKHTELANLLRKHGGKTGAKLEAAGR
jgi:cytohesin